MTHQATERQIVESIDIAASPECVFRALTEPKALLAWWGDPTSYPATHWEMDLRRGGKWLSCWKNLADGSEFELGGDGVVARCSRYARRTCSWCRGGTSGIRGSSTPRCDTRSGASPMVAAGCA